jgi:hypothetical protein
MLMIRCIERRGRAGVAMSGANGYAGVEWKGGEERRMMEIRGGGEQSLGICVFKDLLRGF